MKLKNQVCSLELAKKLKELGVEQRSLFWYKKLLTTDKTPSVIYVEEHQNEICQIASQNYPEYCAAFTVAELGQMLPKWLFGGGLEWESEKQDENDEIWSINVYELKKDCEPDMLFWANEKTEADARAKMLIYLKENNII